MQILPWKKMIANPKHSKENNDKGGKAVGDKDQRCGWITWQGKSTKHAELLNLQTK